VAAIKHVAEELRNTPAVTRQFYVHPAVLAAYEAGTLGETCAHAAAAEPGNGLAELRKSELRTLAVLAADERSTQKRHPRRGPEVALGAPLVAGSPTR
jgi:DNA topoisomerase-1